MKVGLCLGLWVRCLGLWVIGFTGSKIGKKKKIYGENGEGKPGSDTMKFLKYLQIVFFTIFCCLQTFYTKTKDNGPNKLI
jgi:hypothetical protein